MTNTILIRPGSQIIIATGLLEIDGAIRRAAEKQLQGVQTLVVGLVRAPQAKCWQFCISRNGTPALWLSAHHRKRDAEEQIKRVRQAALETDLRNNGAFERLQEELRAQTDPDLEHICGGPPQFHSSRRTGQSPRRREAPAL